MAARPSEALIIELTGRIYEAATSPDLWDDVGERLRAATASDASALHLGPPDDALRTTRMFFGFREEDLDRYVKHFVHIDPYVDALEAMNRVSRNIGRTLVDQELVPHGELERTEFFNDFWRPDMRIANGLGVTLSLEPEWNNFNLFRKTGRPDYEAEYIELVEALAEHLRRAAFIDRRLHAAQAEVEAHRDILDRLPGGVALLDGRGRVLRANQALERIVARSAGLSIARRRLTCSLPEEDAALQRLILQAAEIALRGAHHAGTFACAHRRSGERPLALLVAPLRTARPITGGRGAACIVFVDDPERSAACDPARLEVLYDLTPAESRVATLLSQGHSLPDVAALRRVRVESVRTQLKAVFQKTGTHSQAELVSLVLRSGAVSGAAEHSAEAQDVERGDT